MSSTTPPPPPSTQQQTPGDRTESSPSSSGMREPNVDGPGNDESKTASNNDGDVSDDGDDHGVKEESLYSMDSFVDELPLTSFEDDDDDEKAAAGPPHHQARGKVEVLLPHQVVSGGGGGGNHDMFIASRSNQSSYVSPSSATTVSEGEQERTFFTRNSTNPHPSQQQPHRLPPAVPESAPPLPITATAASAATASGSTQQQYHHDTIESVSSVRKYSTGSATDSLPPIPPVNPFFGASYEEEEPGSDGSIVFDSTHTTTPGGAGTPPLAATSATRGGSPMDRSGGGARNGPRWNRTDRFPSFDSAGSSGSIRYVAPNSAQAPGSPMQHLPPQHQSHSSSSGGHTAQQPAGGGNGGGAKPKIMPYHERLQQRRSRTQQHGGGAPAPAAVAGPAPPRPPDQRQQQIMMGMSPGYVNTAPPPPQSPPSYPPPVILDPSFHSHHQQHAMAMQQHQQQYYPAHLQPPHPQGYPSPPYPGMMPYQHPDGYGSPVQHAPMYPPHLAFQQQQHEHQQQMNQQQMRQQNSQQRQYTSQQQQQQQQQQQSVRAGSLRNTPVGDKAAAASRQPTAGSRRSGNRHSKGHAEQQQSSFPASGLPPMGTRQSQQSQHHLSDTALSRFQFSRHARNDSLESSDGTPTGSRESLVPPPPPPPLPPPPPPSSAPPNFAHVRQDSSGSVSSLGSLDPSSRDDEDKEEGGERTRTGRSRRDSGNAGFFHKLNPFGHKRRPSNTEANIHAFHRKNQAFLRRNNAMRSKAGPTSSPQPTMHRRVGSMDRPPASRGTHKRLPSIENDNWDQDEDEGVDVEQPNSRFVHAWAEMRRAQTSSSGELDKEDSGAVSSSSSSEYSPGSEHAAEPNEQTRLLPPPGISSNEQNDKSYTDEPRAHPSRPPRHRAGSNRKGREQSSASSELYNSATTARMDNTTTTALLEFQMDRERRKQRKKKHKRRARRAQQAAEELSSDESSSSASSQDYHKWMKKRSRLLEEERASLIRQWREEAREEEAAAKRMEETNRWYRRLGSYLDYELGGLLHRTFTFFVWFEGFIANIPLTIGSIALATASLGVDWFKFAEENMNSCEPVHFHSSQCTFPEFPGCFYCDKKARMYQVVVGFHFVCSAIAGVLALTFFAKLVLARRVVFDELSSPTTAAPAGLVCMALDVVFAGRGLIGQMVISAVSVIHLSLAIWFIYMALAYHIMPEPSWFPNTTGIGISAVKTWLYYPLVGHLLMAISLTLNFFFFPISLFRVFMNKKISATVGWMQMSAPNVSLYALTIMAQPSFREEHPDITSFQKMHRAVYLPCMHFLFGMCLLGMAASLYSLLVRWKEFKKLPFSPAHAAFCCPTLSHANAVQAYRGAVNSFSDIPVGSNFKIFIYVYWLISISAGTILTVWIGTKFIWSLPAWTHIDTEGEIEPPAPYETSMTLTNMISTGDTFVQPFVSPAILQSMETGALVLHRTQSGEARYVRTRKVTALGFEPIMDDIHMDIERELLLDYVGKHPPRRRHRTLSVPGIDFSYGANFGTGNTGVYVGSPTPSESRINRLRANTSSPWHIQDRRRFGPPS